jgi:hypothetical protein
MELANFVFQVIHLKLLKHYNIVVSVLTKQAFEADGA